jgi:8-oxo-dGTP pyrophosphatase MutT (NUDIX family)
MQNYFRGKREHPYHLSIGAVIVNDENKVCCHFFKEMTLRKAFEGFTNFYILMRESMEMGESIEQTLHRGLMEEFGITGDVITYLGSLKGNYTVKASEPHYSIEKTTLYFLVRMKTFKPELRAQEDAEKESEIQWQPIDFLIPKMKVQGDKFNSTLDESEMLERSKQYI